MSDTNIFKHGALQFPERCGFVSLPSGDYEAAEDVSLRGYTAPRDRCGDWSCPAGTVIRRLRAGDECSFSRWAVVQWGDGSCSAEAAAEVDRIAEEREAAASAQVEYWAKLEEDAATLRSLSPDTIWAIILDCGQVPGYGGTARITRRQINASLRRLLGANAPQVSNCPSFGHMPKGWWRGETPLYRHLCR